MFLKKHKKVLILVAVILAVVATLLVGFSLLLDAITPKTYTTAKTECENVLEEHRVQLEECALDALNKEKAFFDKCLDYDYIGYPDVGYVVFSIDAQGMLGGQYWELVYTQDGTYYNQTETYQREETSGNNVTKAERLDDHWWYVWTDYDGTDRSDQ